jgi:hypothetical protein
MEKQFYIRKKEDLRHPFLPDIPREVVSKINQFILENNLEVYYALSYVKVNQAGSLPWLCKDDVWFAKEQDRNYFMLFFGEYFTNGSRKEYMMKRAEESRKDYF